MPGFDGTGPRGMGPMTGGGRGFCSPWGIGAVMQYGQGTYGVPYAGGYAYAPYGGMPYPSYGYPGAAPYVPPGPGAPLPPGTMTQEQQLNYLRKQSEVLKSQLEQIGSRIRDLEKK